jgi:UDP-2,3-diacylglucosamine pyrophosphatase LpxH
MVLAGLLLFGAHHAWSWPLMAAVAVSWLLVHRLLTARRKKWFGEKLDNDETLVERAGHLARMFPAAFVVMGHTHTPAMVPVAEGSATYVNVGSWHEAEAEQDRPATFRAARTHLVIHPAESGPRAEFLAWTPDEGPRSFLKG